MDDVNLHSSSPSATACLILRVRIYLPFIAKGRLETYRSLVTNYQAYASIFSNSVIIHSEFIMCYTYPINPTSLFAGGHTR
jgi:hypothetical protein